MEYITEGATTYYKRTIGGVALADYYPSTGIQQTKYLLKDHLGSIHTVLNSTGQIVERMHFAAFGIRQMVDVSLTLDWKTPLTAPEVVIENAITTDGFTGHEHADDVGIIHMNGRSYDPVLGRFLQADPFVQAPKNSQSLNRYSYVFNNPLSFVDPSGYTVYDMRQVPVIWRIRTLNMGGGSGHSASGLDRSVFDPGRDVMKSLPPGILPGAIGNRTGVENELFTDNSVTGATIGTSWSAMTAGNFSNGGASEAFAHAVGDLRQQLDDLAFESGGGFAAFYVSRVLQEFVLVPIEDTAIAISNRDYTGVSVAILGGVFKPVRAAKKAVSALTSDQAANLDRFLKRLPRNAIEPVLRDLPNGGKVFQAEVPGRVPGSKAVYEKQVDAAGKTIQFTKTTYDPAGNIVHVKDKLTGEVFP